MRVVDEHGNDIEPGEQGEVIIRGAHVMKGYWNRPEATAETIRDGWLHTGDVATVDKEGFIYIQDRMKDMVISGGENVYPAEIENVILAHPKVARGRGDRSAEREVGRVAVRGRREEGPVADRARGPRLVQRQARALQAAARGRRSST